MVVMLAIAGAVAAVLFSRANEATEQLEETEIAQVDWANIGSRSLCKSYGGTPQKGTGNSATDMVAGDADSLYTSCKEPS